eukprot:scaffold511_cov62-Cyclotella_meneghiniana.AAC.7
MTTFKNDIRSWDLVPYLLELILGLTSLLPLPIKIILPVMSEFDYFKALGYRQHLIVSVALIRPLIPCTNLPNSSDADLFHTSQNL